MDLFLKDILPFVGGLLGAALGSPVVEAIKDKIGARRSWIGQRKILIERIRFICAGIEAFLDLSNVVHERPEGAPARKVESYRQALMEFDIKPIAEAIQQTVILAPNELGSGAAQHALKKLLIIISLMRSIQAQTDKNLRCDEILIILDKKLANYKLFLMSQYAGHLNLKSLAFGLDLDCGKFETSNLLRDPEVEEKRNISRLKFRRDRAAEAYEE